MGNFFSTRRGKTVMGFVNGFGAAIVIIGAMFKILHFPGGGFVIGLGLAVEALIFILSAFEPVHEELDWTKAYPELKGENEEKAEASSKSLNSGLSEKLNELLADAKIDSDKLRSLERSIVQFTSVVSRISEVTVSQNDAEKYNERILNSIEHMDVLNEVYAKQIEQRNSQLQFDQKVFEDMRGSMEVNRQLQDQMQRLVANLNAINSVYEGMIGAMNIKSNQ